jgi:DNA polymerase-3 subunit delta'
MTLFPIINQKTNLELLHNIVKKKRVANAYLFYGEDGSGTEAVALEFAAILNCTAPEQRPCGQCPACKAMRGLEHPNLTLVFPIPIPKSSRSEDSPFKQLKEDELTEIHTAVRNKAANPYYKISIRRGLHIPINFIREINRSIYLTSATSGQKVVIIFDAHLMSEDAANAFLKILEEPPSFSTFILTTANPEQLLATIRSRCQALFFPPIPFAELEVHLKSKAATPYDARLATYLASGNLLLAEQLLENNLTEIKTYVSQTFAALANGDVKTVYQLTNDLSQIGRTESDYLKQILRGLVFWIRDMSLMRHGSDDGKLIFNEFATTLKELTQKFPLLNFAQMKQSVENCVDFLNRNVYINLAILEMFFNLRDCFKNGLAHD